MCRGLTLKRNLPYRGMAAHLNPVRFFIYMELFKDEWGIDNSELDNTEITTTILYFSIEELAEFKKLCKIGIKKEFGEEYQQKGNLSDFLLTILRQKYAKA